MLHLAGGFARRNKAVDLVLVRAEGQYLDRVPREVRIVDLRARRTIAAIAPLIRYLRSVRPQALVSAMDHVNLVALWARSLAGVDARVAVVIQNTLSMTKRHTPLRRERILPALARRYYPKADEIVAVSQGVAEDFAEAAHLPRERIRVIFNPMVTPEMLARGREEPEHPWLRGANAEKDSAGKPGAAPPVVIGVGRLTPQKDFGLLIRAFASVRQRRPARLLIFGEGEERPRLEALIRKLGIEADAQLPGFASNPFACMARCGVFVLSSGWEGLPGVLIEALAQGCPLVSTDCPSGPREILDGGRYGALVPTGDAAALADAIARTLDAPPDPEPRRQRAALFHVDTIVDQYCAILEGAGAAASAAAGEATAAAPRRNV